MIINGYDEYINLINRMKSEQHIISYAYSDVNMHRAINKKLCAIVTFPSGETQTVSISHPDAPTFDAPEPTDYSITNDDIDIICYFNKLDIDFEVVDDFKFIRDTHVKFSNRKNVNRTIPLNIWSKMYGQVNNILFEEYSELLEQLSTPEASFMKKMLNVFDVIEDSGLKVDPEIFEKYFGKLKYKQLVDKNNMVYTLYSPYTLTQRPSNSFGGINYSALNKSDGSREAFISRYESGRLILIDFDSFHLRLVADRLGVNLPTDKSIHTEFAKKYFPEADEITPELYSLSKTQTFEIMYSNFLDVDTYNIELFEKIKIFKKYTMGAQKMFKLPTGMVIDVHELGIFKAFNYYIQNLEVFYTIPKIEKVLELIQNTNNKLVLYTYDSILIDSEKYDYNLFTQINDILSQNGKFPTKTYIGKNYNQLQEL